MPTGNTGGVAPSGNTDLFQGAWTGWFCLLLVSLLALQDAPLKTLRKFKDNGFLPFIASDQIRSLIAISYIFSKIATFLHLGLQLVILPLQTFDVTL